MSDHTTLHRRVLSRADAAHLLRSARRALQHNTSDASDRIGWAYLVLRERRSMVRLKIDWLLQQRLFDSADALIARSLMQDRDHPLMRWRYAKSLYEQGRVRQAEREMRAVVQQRPKHCGVLRFAAQVACALDNPRHAVALLTMALDEQPKNDSIRAELIDALLRAGLVARAAHMLTLMAAPPPALVSRVLRAQHRPLEAVDILRNALLAGSENCDRSELVSELALTLEEIGDGLTLEQLLTEHDRINDGAKLTLARSAMMFGIITPAMQIIDELIAEQSSCMRGALHAQVAINAVARDLNDSWRALRQLAATRDGIDYRLMADCWLRAQLGRMLNDQGDARAASIDPSISLLQPMLQHAVDVLSAKLQSAATDDEQFDTAAIQQHLAGCLVAMGRSREAMSLLATAAATGTDSLPQVGAHAMDSLYAHDQAALPRRAA